MRGRASAGLILTIDVSGSRLVRNPVVIEAAFAYAPVRRRQLFTGVNFSPAIVNPFRQLGDSGEGLERVLAGQRVESKDPVIVAVHYTCPIITYLDRGKSAVELKGEAAESGLLLRDGPDEDPSFGCPKSTVLTVLPLVI